jgi:hypothetical protein
MKPVSPRPSLLMYVPQTHPAAPASEFAGNLALQLVLAYPLTPTTA